MDLLVKWAGSVDRRLLYGAASEIPRALAANCNYRNTRNNQLHLTGQPALLMHRYLADAGSPAMESIHEDDSRTDARRDDGGPGNGASR